MKTEKRIDNLKIGDCIQLTRGIFEVCNEPEKQSDGSYKIGLFPVVNGKIRKPEQAKTFRFSALFNATIYN